MTTLVEQIISKMGLISDQHALEKTTELIRLLELRSTNVPLQINEYGKIVLCADLACSLLNIEFDHQQALKLSALRKSHYSNNKRMFQKLLDINKLVTVNDICVQLSISEITAKAEELLSLFKSIIKSENADIDHPQYAAIAVFHACRLMKKKVSKPKLMSFSNLRPTQWQQLEYQWEKFISKHLRETNLTHNIHNKIDIIEEKNVSCENIGLIPEAEDYESWKNRMITLARTKLNKLDSNKELKTIHNMNL